MEKRQIAILAPYYKDTDIFYFFLQKRDKNILILPDYFGFFGGGIEKNETPEEGMLREIEEELTIKPEKYTFFSRYESLRTVKYAFYMEVQKNFGEMVEVKEGEYGKFFSENDIRREEKLIDSDKLVLQELAKYFRKEI